MAAYEAQKERKNICKIKGTIEEGKSGNNWRFKQNMTKKWNNWCRNLKVPDNGGHPPHPSPITALR
jgi:hypothetical protein